MAVDFSRFTLVNRTRKRRACWDCYCDLEAGSTCYSFAAICNDAWGNNLLHGYMCPKCAIKSGRVRLLDAPVV